MHRNHKNCKKVLILMLDDQKMPKFVKYNEFVFWLSERDDLYLNQCALCSVLVVKEPRTRMKRDKVKTMITFAGNEYRILTASEYPKVLIKSRNSRFSHFLAPISMMMHTILEMFWYSLSMRYLNDQVKATPGLWWTNHLQYIDPQKLEEWNKNLNGYVLKSKFTID